MSEITKKLLEKWSLSIFINTVYAKLILLSCFRKKYCTYALLWQILTEWLSCTRHVLEHVLWACNGEWQRWVGVGQTRSSKELLVAMSATKKRMRGIIQGLDGCFTLSGWKSFSEKKAFELRFEWQERSHHTKIWRKNIPERGNSSWRDPKAGMSLVCSRKRKAATVA